MVMTGRAGSRFVLLAEPCFFRDDGQARSSRAAEEQWDSPGKKILCCRQCHTPVTDPQAMVAINGKRQHVFANPAGLVFEIGCFASAPGCLRRGRPTAEFSWFVPYAWNFALCGGCHLHLGWYYEAAGQASFYGLIIDRLVEELM